VAEVLNNREARNVKEPGGKELMKLFLILVSSLALILIPSAQAEPNPPQKKKSEEAAKGPERKPAPKQTYAPSRGGAAQSGHNVGIGQGFRGSSQPSTPRMGGPDTKKLGGPDTKPGAKHATSGRTAGATGGKRSARHFELASKSKPTTATAPAVKFRQGARIAGSQNWTGSNYTVFRNYSPVWHDRGWWHHHHDRIVFVFGGWYFWNANYWYPAWGYDPYAYYSYDGPIYAYNDLPPDQVIANVQQALYDQGYYAGPIDGILGPLTRAGIARYQEEHGLYVTSAIDEPTLSSLGMV
jgi:putative peptidoglycan binding protein